MPAEARIARLRIATSGSAGAVTARALVEDALRTAGTPGGPGVTRGLLVVRALGAGRAVSSADRLAVAGRVSAGLERAARTALRPDAPGAERADAVLFRDPFEPFTMLARALLIGSPLAGAWFFRAVFGRLPGAPTEALARLLVRAAETPFAPAALPVLAAEIGARLPAVLAAMGPPDVAVLARTLPAPRLAEAASPPAEAMNGDPRTRVRLHAAPPKLLQAVQGLVRRYGRDDPRAVLAVMACLGEIGAAPPSARETARALATLALPPSDIVPTADRRPAPVADASDAAAPSTDATSRASNRQWPGVPTEMQGAAHPDLSENTANAISTEPLEPADRRTEPTAETSQSPAPQGAMARARQSGATDPSARPMPPARPTAREGNDDTTGTPTLRRQNEPDSRTHDDASPQPPWPTARERDLRPESDPRGEPTAWAGAVLLVGTISRHLPGFVEAEGELGRWLLRRMLTRAGCRPFDPAGRAFGPAPGHRLLDLTRLQITAPNRLAMDGRPMLHTVAGHSGWRALTARGGRLVLALWHGRAPEALRPLAEGARRGRPLTHPMDRAVTTAELLLRRALRQATGRHPRNLIGLSGWIAAGRTHVDVTFDAGLVDIAVRRAGLDIDPGWCPWLSRVVRIHYDYGDAGEPSHAR